MAKILGLDLGTNSIGWAIVDDNKDNFELLDKGSHIFTEGVKNEKGSEKSRASERTSFRAARRLNFHRKLRKYETLKTLEKFGMCPLEKNKIEKWRQYKDPITEKKSTFKYYPQNEIFFNWLKTDEKTEKNPYYFRDKASREKINKLELGRAFYHIAQRRGFLSNRLDKTDEGIIEQHKPELEAIVFEANNSAELLQKIKEYFESFDFDNKKSKDLDAGENELRKLYNKIIKIIENKVKDKNFDTFDKIKDEISTQLNKKDNLGAVKGGIREISEKMKENDCVTLGQYFYHLYKQDRNNKDNKIRKHYTAREDHYQKEFYKICKVQNLSEEITKELHTAIFYQRPLKSQKGLIGKCSLEKNKPRCACSHPLYEEYRMYCFLNNIKIKTPDDEKLRTLTKEEKEKIIPKFFRVSKKHFNFDDLAKALIVGSDYAFYKSNEAKTANYIFNFRPNSTVTGCPVSAAFKSLFGDDWKEKVFTYETLNRKNEKVTRNVNYHDIWNVLFSFSLDKKIKEFAEEKLKLNEKEVRKFSALTLKKDYASLSLKAIKKIMPYLKEGLIYSHAVFMANLENIVDENIWNNENNRKQIENGINKIIEEHTNDTKSINAVNSAIKECKEENKFYTEHNNPFYKGVLEEKLENIFGSKTWHNLENKDEIFSDAFNSFVKSFKENKHVAAKRIDEEVIDFVLGKNENGELFCSDEKRIEKLFHPSDIEIFKKPAKADDGKYYLGSPLIPSIKNPMAMRALHQLRKLINQLIKENKIDENTKIHIELARELNDANKRKAIERYQRERKKKREEYEGKIIDLYKNESENIEIVPTEDDILKYQLWEEQNHICLYTGNNIGICDFIGQNPNYDIEHTIPRSKCNDNSQKNKTLCENQFNRETKINKIPSELSNHEDILQRIQHWKKNYDHYEMLYEIRRRPKGLEDKDKKDKRIQEKHYYKMHADYWKAKYERFIMEEIPDGFKNSQLVDTGIITKYSKIFLKSIFDRVYSVKGSIVADFRIAWGIQEEYKIKERKNHVHHCIDAVVIACLTKNKYDKLAHYYREEEKWEREELSTKPHFEKPWENFSEDMKDLENEILVSHYTPDNLKKRAKKKLRKRGKIQYKAIYKKDKNRNYIKDKKGNKIVEKYFYLKDINNNKIPVSGKKDENNPDFTIHKYIENKEIVCEVFEGNKTITKSEKTKAIEKRKYVKNGKGQIMYQKEPIYLKGDSVRGSLHKDTFFGAIKQPMRNNNGKIEFDENGKMKLKKDKDGNDEIKYVVRKSLNIIEDDSIKNIVDDQVRKIVQNVKKEEKQLNKKYEALKKKSNNSEAHEEKIIKQEMKIIKNKIRNLYTLPNKKGKPIPIKKVRVYQPNVTNPLCIKKQKNKSLINFKHYKEYYNVANDENYCMAIYESKDKKGKIKRDFNVINNHEAGEMFKSSNKNVKLENHLIPSTKIIGDLELPFKAIIKTGTMVILWENNPKEIWDLKTIELRKRFYKIVGISTNRVKSGAKYYNYGNIILRHNQEATRASDLKTYDGKFKSDERYIGQRKLSHKQFNALIEGIDFKLTPLGKIEKC